MLSNICSSTSHLHPERPAYHIKQVISDLQPGLIHCLALSRCFAALLCWVESALHNAVLYRGFVPIPPPDV